MMSKTAFKPINSLQNGRKLRHVKIVRTKGKAYAYFNNGPRRGSDPLYSRIPFPGMAGFKVRYREKCEERQRRETMPYTVMELIRAYQLSNDFGRLSPASKRHYTMLLRPMENAAGSQLIDLLTPAEVAAVAATFEARTMRRQCVKVVTVLYNWAHRKGFSAPGTNPVHGLITRPSRQEWIYFIGAGAGHPVKIGRAVSLQKRLGELQVGNHYALSVIVAYQTWNGVAEERRMHALFAEHSIRGEWFAHHPDILAEIERLNHESQP